MLDQAAMPQQDQPSPLPCLIFECRHLMDDESASKSATSAVTSSSGLSKPAQIRIFTFCPTMVMCRGGDVAEGGTANCLAKLVKLVIVCHCSHTHESLFTNQAVPGSESPSAADLADVLTSRNATNADTTRTVQQQQRIPSVPVDPLEISSDPSPEEQRHTQEQSNIIFNMPAKQTRQKDAWNQAVCAGLKLALMEKISSSPIRRDRVSGHEKSTANSGGRNTSAEETRTANTATPQADIEKKYFTAAGSTTREDAHLEESTLLLGEVKQKTPPLLEPALVEFDFTNKDDATSLSPPSSNHDASLPGTPTTTTTSEASSSSEKDASPSPAEEASSHVAWGVDPLPEPLEDWAQHSEDSTGTQKPVQLRLMVLSPLTLKDTPKGTSKDTPKGTSKDNWRDSLKDLLKDNPKPEWDRLYSLKGLDEKEDSDMVTELGSHQSDLSEFEFSAESCSSKPLSVNISEPCHRAAPTTTAVQSAAANAETAVVAAETAVAAAVDELNRRGRCSNNGSEKGSPPTADRIKEPESEINAAEVGTAAQTKKEGKTPSQQPQQQQPQSTASQAESTQSQFSRGYCEDLPPAIIYQQYPMCRIYEVNRGLFAMASPETGGSSKTSISLARNVSPSLMVMTTGFHDADIFNQELEREGQESPPLSQKPLTTRATESHDSATTPHADQAAAAPHTGAAAAASDPAASATAAASTTAASAAAADCGSITDSMLVCVGSSDVLSSSSTKSNLHDTAIAEHRRQYQQQLQRRHDGESGTNCQLESVAVRTQNTVTTELPTAACTLQCCECCTCPEVQSTVNWCRQHFSPLLLVYHLASHANCYLCQTVAYQSSAAQLLKVTCPPRVRRCPQPSTTSMAKTCDSEASCDTNSQKKQKKKPTCSHVQRPHRHNHRRCHHHRHQRRYPITGRHNITTETGELMLSSQRLLEPDAVTCPTGSSLVGGGGGYLKQALSREYSYAAPGLHQHPMLHHNSSSSELAALSASAVASPDVRSEAAVHLMVQPSETNTVTDGISGIDTGSCCYLIDL